MTNKYKKEREEYNRRIYGNKSLPELKIIGKKKGLLNVDQYKKANKNVSVERLVKGKQLSDESKNVLLEKAQNEGLNANASMSKNVILQKITNPKLTDLNEKRLRKLAEKKGIPLRSQMTNKAIIQRLENPTDYYTVESLKRLARNNNIDVRRNISKPDLIKILGERNLITTTPITAQESYLGVLVSNVPIELIRKAKKKARNAREALLNFKEYIKNIKSPYLTSNRIKKLFKQLKKKEKEAKEEHDRIFTPIKGLSAFNNFVNQYVINGDEYYDVRSFLNEAKPSITNVLNTDRGVRTALYLKCIMERETNGGLVKAEFLFHSNGHKLILEDTDVEEVYDEMTDEIEESIQKVKYAEGSGWRFSKIINLTLHTAKWDPFNAGSYIDLPPFLKNKKAIINMQNQDEKCFLWSVLRALNPKDKNAERIDSDLKSKQNTLNMEGIRYPVNFRDIDRFESQNPNISISVLGYNEKNKTVYPLKTSKYTRCEHDIVLLLIKGWKIDDNGEEKKNSHYVLVKNKSALLAAQINNHKGTRHICLNCFCSFKTPEASEKHADYCYNNECIKTIMPEPGTYLSFENFLHSEKVPFVVYSDFEALNKKINTCEPDPNKSYTKKQQKHEPISFSYYIKCFDNNVCEPILRSYTKEKEEDEDAVDVFIKWLEDDVKEIANIKTKKIIFTEEDEKQFNKSKECWICKEPFKDGKVRDHCHYTGRYRGPACNSCNLKYRKPNFIPVFFHNLSGYDSHLFIKKLGSTDERETIECIPNNEEKYISITKNKIVGKTKNKKPRFFKIRFLDSLKFMGASIETLVNNSPKDGLKNLERYHTGEKAELIKQKGFYPYEYMDTIERFKETELPPKKAFYSRLSGKGITKANYKHALNVWNTFNMKTLLDYHDLYNETDVLLLADVFENFRDLCLKIYGLDPAHYFTAPGLSWDACLKTTNINLELLSDLDMLLMFEKMIRGGISIISNRYGKANNKYMKKGFNMNEALKFLMYLDANNLYGGAMSEKLPTHGFKWLTGGEMEKIYENRHNLNKIPCILEVDIHYPKELHDKHNDYPLCPERVKCKNGVEKLIPNLRDKKKYVIHYKNLIQCLDMGLKVTHIHRGIKFIESEWMKPYIDMNTALRANAKNNFEKDFFKLMNNSVFGKTMENIRNRVVVKLVNTKEKARKLINNPRLKSPPKIFSENLISVHLKKTSLTMNKPVYLGACMLDLSKTIMYDFHYNYIIPKYGNKVKLLFTDTDSLMYEIETEDFYKDISEDVKDRFDTSDYPENHPSGIPTGINKKVLGMFKDEAAGKIIKEFVGLRAKLYSFVTDGGEESKKCKGIKKQVVENSITHKDYKTCLLTGKEQLRKQNIIRSYEHEVYTEEVNKVALSAGDDKRYILEDGIHTLAWGHYKIKDH